MGHTRSRFVRRLLALLGIACLALPLILWSDDPSRGLLANTLYLAAGAGLISLPIGSLLAFLVVRTDVPGRRVAGCLIAGMLFVPLYLQAAGWDAGFGKQGWYTLSAELLSRPPLQGWSGAIWIHGMAAIPWVFLIVAAGLRFVEPHLEEQASLDAGPAGVLRRVTLPRGLATIGVAALWIVIGISGEMTVTDMYRVRTFAEVLYTEFAQRETLIEVNLSLAPGLAFLTALVAATILVLRWIAPPGGELNYRPPYVFRLGRLKWLAALLLAAALVLLVGVPLGNVIYKAGITVELSGDERIRTWSVAKALEIVADSPYRFRRNHFWTLSIGAATACSSLIVGALLAWSARRGGWRTIPAMLIATVCLALPGPLVGMSLLRLRGISAATAWLFDETLFAPILAMTLRCLPLVTLILWYALRSLPREQFESAQTEGASSTTGLVLVVVPQRYAAAALAWLVAFVIASSDLATSILIVPPGVMTVAIRVFDFLHAGVDDQVAGICLSSVLIYILIGGLGLSLAAFWRRTGEG